MRAPERTLLRRIAEARGRRVPISELVSSYGLPPVPSLEQDFPGLTYFLAEQKQKGKEMEAPLIASGSDEKGWYWMPPHLTGVFRTVLAEAAGESVHGSDQQLRTTQASN
jgi:hypothetical protein